MLSIALYVAALLTFVIGLVHSYLGERYLLIRLIGHESFPKIFRHAQFAARTLRFAWHLTTLAWWGLAVILLQLAAGTASPANVAWALSLTFLLSGLVSLIASRGKHLSWPVFLSIGLIAGWAATAGN